MLKLGDDVTLYLGNCLEVMPTLGRVDAVITDPPWICAVLVSCDRIDINRQDYQWNLLLPLFQILDKAVYDERV